jgi:hypothetical protein
VILPVPYRSQLAADAGFGKGDCGPASFAMVLNALAFYISVDALGRILEKPANYTITNLRELQTLARDTFGFALGYRSRMTLAEVREAIEARRPIIALVWYPLLPNRFDPAYTNGHFVVIVGVEDEAIIYHDPYYRGQAGATLKGSWEAFSKAWSAVGNGAFNVPRQGLLSPPLPAPPVHANPDLQTIKDIRWWCEESTRFMEAGQAAPDPAEAAASIARARDILLNEVVPRLYVVEGSL